MLTNTKELQRMIALLEQLHKRLDDFDLSQHFDEWIPRKALMDFFNYGDTQIAALLKDENLIVSEVGNRKFIYKPSVKKLLEKNIKKSNQIAVTSNAVEHNSML